MQKKKILIVSHAMEIGGAERALLGLLENIDTNTYDVDLFLLRQEGELMKFIPNNINLLPEIPQYTVLARPMIQTLKEGHIILTAARLYGRKKAEHYVKKEKLKELKESIKKLEKDYKTLKMQNSITDITAFTTNMEIIDGMKTSIVILEDYDIDSMKSIADAIINKYDNCFVLLANTKENHVNIIAKANTDKVNCGAIVKELSVKCKGNGGGSKFFAQGGGSEAAQLAEYLNEIKSTLKNN